MRSELLWDHDIFFGVTTTNNDVLYHWVTLSAAKSIGFMPMHTPVVRHTYHGNARAQLTTSSSPQRVYVIEAVLQTHRRLASMGFYSSMSNNGSAVEAFHSFSAELFLWAEQRMPKGNRKEFKELVGGGVMGGRCACLR